MTNIDKVGIVCPQCSLMGREAELTYIPSTEEGMPGYKICRSCCWQEPIVRDGIRLKVVHGRLVPYDWCNWTECERCGFIEYVTEKSSWVTHTPTECASRQRDHVVRIVEREVRQATVERLDQIIVILERLEHMLAER